MGIANLKQKCVDLFTSSFGETEKIFGAFAPGRVNLIGEHTDYNNGYVFPMALTDIGTVVVGCPQVDFKLEVATDAAVDTPFYSIDSAADKLDDVPKWVSYVIGVIRCFEETTGAKVGIKLSICANLPIGAGLSSSASLEVAVFSMLQQAYGFSDIPAITKIKACQKAEHEYAHVPCGIMDQFIATLGQEGKALLINCETDEYEVLPFGREDLRLVIIDTHVKHELAGSEYADRKKTCEAVAHSMGFKSLGDINMEQLVKHFSSSILIQEPLPRKSLARARHVVSEINRTLEAKKSLLKGDLRMFGHLMNESHKSLAADYEVTCKELDEVVQVAWETEGVYGARMTGGGFGGCAIALVDADKEELLGKRLAEHCPYSSSFSTTAGAGATFLDF